MERMTGSVKMYNAGVNLEYYFIELEDYSSFFRSSGSVNPFVSLGLHYTHSQPDIFVDGVSLKGQEEPYEDLIPKWQEGAIFLDVKVNKDSPGQQTLSGPAIDTKNVQTQVLVENGGTVVLGGIFEQQDRKTVTKVPFLGDLPVVGYLFKNTSTVSDRSELLIFITPRIVTSQVSGR